MPIQSSKPEAIRYLEERLGQEIFVSKWHEIAQQDTDTFAKLTNDEDPMHNDPKWAAQTHWGGTIVQAAHVLSLGVSVITDSDVPLHTKSDGNCYVLNYGYDRVRVIAPLRVGHPFRYRGKVVNIRPKSEKEYVLQFDVTVEVKGCDKPFMVYESLVYWATNQDMAAVG